MFKLKIDCFCAGFSDACMTNPTARSGGRRRRSAKVSEVDDTSIFRKRPTGGYPCSLSGLSRSQKGFPPRQPIAAVI
jgi:hypothetical protein